MTGRALWASIALAAVALMGLPVVFASPKVLLWNASASVPIGLYSVHKPGVLKVGDIVVAWAPEPLARYLAARRSLPRGVPLIKPVAALAGQTVCRQGGALSIDGVALAHAMDRDRLGRTLPQWRGCRVLGRSEVFLMNAGQPDSLDGRYFGPLPTTAIVGRAVPIWIPKAR